MPARHRLVWVSFCSIGFATLLSWSISEGDGGDGGGGGDGGDGGDGGCSDDALNGTNGEAAVNTCENTADDAVSFSGTDGQGRRVDVRRAA